MDASLSEKENRIRAIKRAHPHHVPVRRMDGVIPGMVKVYYHGSRMTEAEVKRCLRLLGEGGGYILGPDNLVPIPEANYQAYLAAGHRYGRYPLRLES
ncbi:MAG: hypothetical protein FJW26_08375 [Acidimicrobiia bacterium]|nr:hypothetical protein [Acidimicrobiia bacterium]